MAKLMTLEGFRKLERRDFENGAVLAQIAVALREREELVASVWTARWMQERERQAARKLLDILHRCPRRECHGVGGQTIDASLSRMRVHDVPWRAVLDFEEVLAGEEGDDD